MSWNDAHAHIKCWSPLTTRLLREGNASAWNVMDGAMGEKLSREIEEELKIKSNLMEKLKPARTKGEIELNPLLFMGLLQQNDDSGSIIPPIRGDKSIFLSREVRSDPTFPNRYPGLHQLFESIQATVTFHLASAITFDTSLTSVQLAVYPGDRKSGYLRHRDRTTQPSNVSESANPERIITIVYYLTNEDWSATQDGGALRIFADSESVYTDVVPYRDRLVVFRSDCVEHQVCPSLRRDRIAITMWFYGSLRDIGSKIPSPLHTPNSNHDVPLSRLENPTIFQSPSTPYPPPLKISLSLHHSTISDRKSSVFVCIASFRDSETVPTIQSLFSMAQDPRRVVVGLTLQLDLQKDDSIWKQVQDIAEYKKGQVRCITMEASDAKGPCYARALCQSLHKEEDYVLQIDSHMRFRQNWDSYLIALHGGIVQQRTQNPETAVHASKVILTTYPVGYTLPNNIPTETRGTLLVPWKFADGDLLRQRGRLLKPRKTPVSCHLVAAGFLFGPATLIEDVPYDIRLHQLFFGEELSLAIRLYTHGYDCYAPPESVCYHLWSRSHRPTQKPMTEKEISQRHKSIDIIKRQLLGENTPHGLGTMRTPSEFAKALGVDFSKASFTTIDFENGGLSESEFVQECEPSLFPLDSLESKVAMLDNNVKELLVSFLTTL